MFFLASTPSFLDFNRNFEFSGFTNFLESCGMDSLTNSAIFSVMRFN